MFNITDIKTAIADKTSNAIVDQQSIDSNTANAIKEKSTLEVHLAYNKSLLSDLKDLQDEEKKTINQENDTLKNKITKIDSAVININHDPNLKLLQQLYSSLTKTLKYFNLLENAKHINNELVAFSTRDIDYKTSSETVDVILKRYSSVKHPELLLSNFNNYFNEFRNSYLKYYQYIDEICKTEKNAQKKQKNAATKQSLSSLSSELEYLKSNVDGYDFQGLFASLNNILFELKKESNFFVVSDPVQAEKDVVNFKINITPRSDASVSSNLDNRNFTASVPVVGGFKFDFSTGLFLTSGLYDRQYSTTAFSDSSIIAKNKNHNIANISLGALLHISQRSKCDYKLGGSIGVGLSSNDLSKLNVFIGPCCIIGKQEQLIVSLGVAFAQVDYLKGKYSLDTKYKTSELDQTLTEKVTRIGGFISITYNFTSQKKE
jgi:predicted  nucleic acid-binding Zn-ribbon protein